MMNKILITGISGFVGTNLVNYFKVNESFVLYGLDIVTESIVGVEKIYAWDEIDTIKDIDIVIHLAGKAHDTQNTSSDSVYFDVNLGLTKKIYEWYLNSSSTQFYMMSSVKAVVDTANGIVTEEVDPSPLTAYGRSKYEAERFLNSLNLPSDKKLYIFRPCMIHGPNNKGNLNLLYKVVSKSIPWPLGAYKNRRSFLSVCNLCFIFNKFIAISPQSGLYNLADDVPVSTNDLIRLIGLANNKKTIILNIPRFLIMILANIGDFFRLPLDSERLKKLTEDYIVSNEKLLIALGEELPVSSRDGLMSTLKSFK